MKLLWFILTIYILIKISFCRSSYFSFIFMRNNKYPLTLGTSKLPTHSATKLSKHHQSPPLNDVDFIYANNTINHQFIHNLLIVNIHLYNNTICDPKININSLELNNNINKKHLFK